ncbi:acylneuraminate cytidylyltransferase family protein [Oceanospirillaceae bacterium]|nr:acylneuraminate cytidylyltransferase family protein [bacterium]MDB4214345.1 acylneuraminate cytidylyltransferase family protein [Oceanospirillaceae bacterium]
MTSKVLALIPARGGSKGVPGKNILNIDGQPMISYSIEQAINSKYINRTIVSTDDNEIADVARRYNAEVPFLRPSELAQDLSPDIDVFEHALNWLQENENYQPDFIVHLRPTGPVRSVKIIDKAIEKILQDETATALRSVSTPVQTPYKMWSLVGGYLFPLIRLEGFNDAHSMPRQMLPLPYWQNGYIDIVKPLTILKDKSMTGNKVIPFIIEEPIYEIDYPESIPIVEEALKNIKSGEIPHEVPSFSNIKRHPV